MCADSLDKQANNRDVVVAGVGFTPQRAVGYQGRIRAEILYCRGELIVVARWQRRVHFLLAYTYRPERAVSICISRQSNTDVQAGQQYVSTGHVITFEPECSQPRVLVSIRAAGLAAESLIYGESFEDLMNSPSIRCRVKTDT